MKAIVVYGHNKIEIKEIEKPRIAPTEVLIQVRCAGVCGSDIHRVIKDSAHHYPNVLGHEFTGEIVVVGDRVTKVTVGQRVTAAPLVPCLKCEACQKGLFALCKNYYFRGNMKNGAWAEYIQLPEENVVPLGDKVSDEQGVFVEPLSVVLHGLTLMPFIPNQPVGIIGLGTIGLLTLQVVKAFGAKEIYVVDIDQKKHKLAKTLGATYCYHPITDKALLDEVCEQGLPLMIETAGVPETEVLALKMASPKGNVMYIGTPSKDITFTKEEFEWINRKELSMKGSWMSYEAPFPGESWNSAVDLLNQGKIKWQQLVDQVVDLDESIEVLKKFNQPQAINGKVIIRMKEKMTP